MALIDGSASATPRAKTGLRPAGAFVVSACLVGLFLRVYFYALNRPLWLDEAMLALNLVRRSFAGLLTPLDLNQGAPVGFLLAQKAVISLLGSSEYALRLLPLLCGLAAVPLMYLVSRRYVKGVAPLLSLGLFALSWRLVYYSSEVKQYSIDVLITLVVLFFVPPCLEDEVKPRAFAALGIAGSVALWFSHPSLFVLAGIFLTLGLASARRRTPGHLVRLAGVGGAWGINLGLNYLVSLRHLAANAGFAEYWSGSFAPLPPWSNLAWYPDALKRFFTDPAGLTLGAISLAVLLLGILSLVSRRPLLLATLIAPFLLTLLASALGKYPFSGRLLLFLLPLLLLLLAEGVERVRTALLRFNRPLAQLAAALLAAYLLHDPAALVWNNVRTPPMRGYLNPVMSRISTLRRSTDVIYVHCAAGPVFEFYAPRYGFSREDYIVGSPGRIDPARLLADIDALKGTPRVWFVFGHRYGGDGIDERKYMLKQLRKTGVRKRRYKAGGSSAYLFDLSGPPRSPRNGR